MSVSCLIGALVRAYIVNTGFNTGNPVSKFFNTEIPVLRNRPGIAYPTCQPPTQFEQWSHLLNLAVLARPIGMLFNMGLFSGSHQTAGPLLPQTFNVDWLFSANLAENWSPTRRGLVGLPPITRRFANGNFFIKPLFMPQKCCSESAFASHHRLIGAIRLLAYIY